MKNKIKLEYNFNKKAKLEIKTLTRTVDEWRIVSPDIFRSWIGPRRVDEKIFKDKSFIYLTNISI